MEEITSKIVLGEESGFPDHMFVCDLFNHKLMKEAEIPSANMHSSSYALAKVASVMAGKGIFYLISFNFIF